MQHIRFFFHLALKESKEISSNFYGQQDEKGHLRDLAVGGGIDLITHA